MLDKGDVRDVKGSCDGGWNMPSKVDALSFARRCGVFVGAIMATQLSSERPCRCARAAGSGQTSPSHANELHKGRVEGSRLSEVQEEGNGQSSIWQDITETMQPTRIAQEQLSCLYSPLGRR